MYKNNTNIFFLIVMLIFVNNVTAQNSIYQNWRKTVGKNFFNNDLFLFGGMNLSKQTINDNGYSSPFNYRLEDINKNVSLPGYFVGARLDGVYKNKHLYSISFGMNKIAAGAHYTNKKTIDPFIENFSNFKADQQMFTFNISVHCKRFLPITDPNKYKFFIVGGPSADIRLSNQSLDNKTINLYKPLLIRADIGVEFDNHSYYTLFLHYKQGINSIVRAPIHNQLNTVEFGVLLKANDLF